MRRIHHITRTQTPPPWHPTIYESYYDPVALGKYTTITEFLSRLAAPGEVHMLRIESGTAVFRLIDLNCFPRFQLELPSALDPSAQVFRSVAHLLRTPLSPQTLYIPCVHRALFCTIYSRWQRCKGSMHHTGTIGSTSQLGHLIIVDSQCQICQVLSYSIVFAPSLLPYALPEG